MNIDEMNLLEVDFRLAELEVEVREATDVEAVNAAAEEKRRLLERKAELAEIEQRKADAEALNSGEATPEKIIDIPNVVEEKRMFSVESVEYRNAWLKNLMGKPVDEEERAALSGQAGVIPTETLNKIAARLADNALIGKVDLMQIPGYVRVPVYSTNGGASWSYSPSDSSDAITYIDLKPYQLIKNIPVQADMARMAIPAFEAEITKILANAIEKDLQKAILVGTGAANSQPTGIATTVSSDTGTFTKAAITKADILKIMGSLPSDFQAGACWIMPNAVLYECMANVSLDGFAGLAAGVGYHIGGKPVVVDDNCIISSTDTIFYGDPKHYRLNLGEGVNVTRSVEADFKNNGVVFRGVCQADGQLDMAAAFVRYSRATA